MRALKAAGFAVEDIDFVMCGFCELAKCMG